MTTTERRVRRRFHIKLRVQYFVPSRNSHPLQGEGVTENISSSGVLFRCGEGKIGPGAYIMLELDWPYRGPDGGELRLSMSGHIVRVEPPLMAVAIGMHDFKRSAEEPAAEASKGTNPASRPLVLVVETEATYRFVAAMLSRYECPVVRVDGRVAQSLLKAEDSPVRLLITNRMDEFAAIQGRVPIVYTGDAAAMPNVPSGVTVVGRPLKYGACRSAVESLLAELKKPSDES